MIRKPHSEVVIPDLIKSDIKWHELCCELVTPMYGGGVKSTVVDEKVPTRASSIRGQLRFWWRLLAKEKWQLGNNEAIRDAELALWGGMGDADSGNASQVFIKVKQPKPEVIELVDYKDIDLPYVLYPAANETDDQRKPHRLLAANDVNFSVCVWR